MRTRQYKYLANFTTSDHYSSPSSDRARDLPQDFAHTWLRAQTHGEVQSSKLTFWHSCPKSDRCSPRRPNTVCRQKPISRSTQHAEKSPPPTPTGLLDKIPPSPFPAPREPPRQFGAPRDGARRGKGAGVNTRPLSIIGTPPRLLVTGTGFSSPCKRLI